MKASQLIVGILTAAFFVSSLCGCAQGPSKTVQGAGMGAAIGGVTGAIVGHNMGHGRRDKGLLVGATAGALAGGLLGRGMDQTEAAVEAQQAQSAATVVACPHCQGHVDVTGLTPPARCPHCKQVFSF